jgi:MbtH protein
MNKRETETFAIIVNTEHQFGVWPAHRRLPPGWRFTGPTGTQVAMQQLLREQFVETVPAALITAGRRSSPSQWAD